MKKIIYIFIILTIIRCSHSKSEQKKIRFSDTLTNQILDKTITQSNDFSKKNQIKEHQIENYIKQSLRGFEKATLYNLTDTRHYTESSNSSDYFNLTYQRDSDHKDCKFV